jgi:hypothetical protein
MHSKCVPRLVSGESMAIRANTRVRIRQATPPESYLGKWKSRANDRLKRLEESLAKPAEQGKTTSRREWLERMTKLSQSRIEWLEARLEHSRALQQVLRRSMERMDQEPRPPSPSPSPSPSAAPAEQAPEQPRKRDRGPS